ncbi:cytochrome c oxidase assembly protein [Kribbella sp.]|uniref:cytochrome c oxidase assembly protein n=1 Tax=Kribbella sp. TaxID=1871183 RepID=UPI002D55334A|nr:cytochrome c oxidase assembly protein [Kribbella sp.]HZX07971.1 cytochrome c oxidase assembly protein [Kribbella sp.]
MPVLVGLLIVGAAYLIGVRRVRRAGGTWSVGRTLVFFGGGLGSVVVLTMSFLGTYDRVLFWPYAVQNVLLLALTPVLLAFGGPVELIGRNFPSVRAARLVKVLTFPAVSTLLGAVLLPLVYFTPYYLAVLQNDVLHELLRLQLVVAGCLFFWPMLGGESLPAWCTPPVRVAIGFLDGLLDALPGILIMTSSGTLAASYYLSVRHGWGPAPHEDQRFGGGIMLTLAEMVGLPFLGGQLVAWIRADRAEAVAVDRRLDQVVAERAAAGEREPELMRPWWETDPGQLADRFRPQRDDD